MLQNTFKIYSENHKTLLKGSKNAWVHRDAMCVAWEPSRPHSKSSSLQIDLQIQPQVHQALHRLDLPSLKFLWKSKERDRQAIRKAKSKAAGPGRSQDLPSTSSRHEMACKPQASHRHQQSQQPRNPPRTQLPDCSGGARACPEERKVFSKVLVSWVFI